MDHERIIYIYDYSVTVHGREPLCINQPDTRTPRQCLQSDQKVKNVTIRRDLDRLTAMGNHKKHNREHNTAYYALIDKSFSFNEIRFIVDSIR